MLDAFDPQLVALAAQCGEKLGIRMQQGVYLGLLGPSFETPAEIRMFASWGADTVAMSVVEEVIVARHMGMRVLGMSLVSNMACGVAGAESEFRRGHGCRKDARSGFQPTDGNDPGCTINASGSVSLHRLCPI